ncbi:hypothetical protein [Burkholderia sp. NRF60-BP8]|uniref:hypothetical protein n=1 Tax=Burkholderia sp. NRF60-BP8 TaxID=1637853 RepID=UPI000A5044FC|nr:hypothetical protein [Burkholderia sp. NRF60-BP8]
MRSATRKCDSLDADGGSPMRVAGGGPTMKRFGANDAIGTRIAGIHRPDMRPTVTEPAIRIALPRERGWLPIWRSAPRFGVADRSCFSVGTETRADRPDATHSIGCLG